MIPAKYTLLALGLCAISAPVQAQDRNITEADLHQLFTEMFMQIEMSVDTDDVKLENKQRTEIAEQILYHYTEDFTRKFRNKVMVENNTFGQPYKVSENRIGYKARLANEERAFKNLKFNYRFDNVEYMGQRAIVHATVVATYNTDATGYKFDPKMKSDNIVKSECEYHVKLEYDDMPRISYETCDMKTFVSNVSIYDESDYKEVARFLADPPKLKTAYILEGFNASQTQ